MAPRDPTPAFPLLSRSVAASIEAHLAEELERLRRRLSAAARTQAARTPAPRAPARARKPRRATCRPPPALELASGVAAALRARGVRDAELVQGLIVVPGTGAPAPHAWVESGDRVHDHTQGEFRTVWPRELYYRVFRAMPRAA
ncbi:MAG TPA: hypothetical protein VFM53_02130 [Anaeromyxobacteraceae bacterium]|nr:hypothetical protein [Anaeromyxobacteraceae bacterium]